MLIATRKGSRMIVAALLDANANPNFMLKVWFIVQFLSLKYGILVKK